jgi:hypothetical protein
MVVQRGWMAGVPSEGNLRNGKKMGGDTCVEVQTVPLTKRVFAKELAHASNRPPFADLQP